VRRLAIGALDYARGKELSVELTRLLADDDWRVRADAAKQLAKHDRDPAAARELGKRLTDPEWQVRKEAALALGQLGAEEHVGQVASLLDDEVADVRRAALNALALLRAVFARQPIARLLDDPDSEVSKAARRALAVLDQPRQEAVVTTTPTTVSNQVRR
jgi:HEAT repeat protein